jgi:hypothetical protein
MAVASPERQLAGFIAKFNPEVARVAKLARTELRKLLPSVFGAPLPFPWVERTDGGRVS